MLVLSNRMLPNRQCAFSDIRRQIVSKSLAIQDCQITSDDLAIGEHQVASNQDDACPHHLAILVTSCWRHQAKGKGIHAKYSTLPTENLIKPIIRWKHGISSCERGYPRDGYHHRHSNKRYANCWVSCKVQYYHWSNPPEADHWCGRGKGKPKKGYHCSNKYYLKAYSAGSVRPRS